MLDSEYFKNRFSRKSINSPNNDASQSSGSNFNNQNGAGRRQTFLRSSLNNWTSNSVTLIPISSNFTNSIKNGNNQELVNKSSNIDLSKRKMFLKENEPGRKKFCQSLEDNLN